MGKRISFANELGGPSVTFPYLPGHKLVINGLYITISPMTSITGPVNILMFGLNFISADISNQMVFKITPSTTNITTVHIPFNGGIEGAAYPTPVTISVEPSGSDVMDEAIVNAWGYLEELG